MKFGGHDPAQGLGPLRQKKSRCLVREFLLLNGGTVHFGEGLLLLQGLTCRPGVDTVIVTVWPLRHCC